MRLTEGEDLGVPMDKKGGEERAKKVLRYFELYCMIRPLDSLIQFITHGKLRLNALYEIRKGWDGTWVEKD